MGQKVNIILYYLTGVIACSLGAFALIMPDWIVASSPEVCQDSLAHLFQEFGSGVFFVGLVAFWCATHYRQSRSLHYLIMAFFALIALVHWWEFMQDNRNVYSPLINSVPLAISALMLFIDKPQTAS